MSAQYPSAVKTFTTKSAGNVIQPADVNDLQDEVNAIEDGLLNGSARLNSSNSTVRALSVLGGSTFAAGIVIASSATITAGGSVGTAGQALVSNGSSGVQWGSPGGVTKYTATLSTATGITSSLAVLSFEISSGTWASGERIEIVAGCNVGSSATNQTFTHSFRVGSNKVSGPAVQQTAGSTIVLARYTLLRASTSVLVNAGLVSGQTYNIDDAPIANMTNNGWTRVISGVDFASSNKVAVVITPQNSSMTFGVIDANVAKF